MRRLVGIFGIVAAISAVPAFVGGALVDFIWRAVGGDAGREGGGGVLTAAESDAMMRRGIKVGVIVAVLGLVFGGGLVGALVVVSGVAPIKASSGHWAITRWFLNFSMSRSVSSHSWNIKVPSFDDSVMVLKGGGHYEIGCAACHGTPSMPQPRIAEQMTPKPPNLREVLSKWEPEELFYIVKHGVKFTGMPAWPSQQRNDEVWAMVAFLRKLPELSSDEYERLVRGEAFAAAPSQKVVALTAVPAAVTRSCMPCHGTDGLGRGNAAFPRIAGQRIDYLRNALTAYAAGDRRSGIMQPIAASLKGEEIEEIAKYYAGLRRPPGAVTGIADPEAISRGQAIAQRGIPAQRVPSCVDCHGPKGTHEKPAYPTLAGQYADYLVLQLKLFRKQQRGGSQYRHLMDLVASRLSPQQMRDVARYFESL